MDRPSFAVNLKSLECFRTIVDEGSVTAAAAQLQMTQPGVSRLLGVLERSIGLELFQRTRGRLIPTPEALAFYKEVDIALQSIDRVSELARNLRNADFGELAIVSPPSLAEGLLSRVISEFIAEHPNVRVSLDSQSVEKARDMVALRAVDCGFIKLPVEHPGLACEPLISAGTICAVPPGHRLSKKKVIRVRDLDGEPLILLGKGRASRQQIDGAFLDAGVRMEVRVETHTVGSACAFARDGTGIAIINEILGMQYENRGVALRRFSPNFTHEYALMTAADAPMTRVMAMFMEHCKTSLRAHSRTLRQ